MIDIVPSKYPIKVLYFFDICFSGLIFIFLFLILNYTDLLVKCILNYIIKSLWYNNKINDTVEVSGTMGLWLIFSKILSSLSFLNPFGDIFF